MAARPRRCNHPQKNRSKMRQGPPGGVAEEEDEDEGPLGCASSLHLVDAGTEIGAPTPMIAPCFRLVSRASFCQAARADVTPARGAQVRAPGTSSDGWLAGRL